MRLIEVRLIVSIENHASPEQATAQVFDLVSSDPDDAAPLVITVDGAEWGSVNE